MQFYLLKLSISMTLPQTKFQEGYKAWKQFLQRRFEWKTDPKNPYSKNSPSNKEWKRGYEYGQGKFFRE